MYTFSTALFGRFRRCGLIEGSISLGVGFEDSKPCAISRMLSVLPACVSRNESWIHIELDSPYTEFSERIVDTVHKIAPVAISCLYVVIMEFNLL